MAAIGKSKAPGNKSIPKKEKKAPFKFERGPGTKKRKKEKKYETGISGLARAKKAMTSDKAYALPFGETFRAAKKAGKSKFRWKGNQFTTRTKAELEKSSKMDKFKERFDPTKIKAAPKKKKSWIKTFGESKTLKEFAKKMKARKS